MQNSRFCRRAAWKNPRPANQPASCALIGQRRAKAEVRSAGDSPREVPDSSRLYKTYSAISSFGASYLCIWRSGDDAALVSKQLIRLFFFFFFWRLTRMKVRGQSLGGGEGNLWPSLATGWMSFAKSASEFEEYGTTRNWTYCYTLKRSTRVGSLSPAQSSLASSRSRCCLLPQPAAAAVSVWQTWLIHSWWQIKIGIILLSISTLDC